MIFVNKPFYDQNFTNNFNLLFQLEDLDFNNQRLGDEVHTGSSCICSGYSSYYGYICSGAREYYDIYIYNEGFPFFNGGIDDAGNITSNSYAGGQLLSFLKICNSDYLEFLDIVNLKLYDGTLTTLFTKEQLNGILNLLYAQDNDKTNLLFTIFYKKNLITETLYNKLVNKIFSFTNNIFADFIFTKIDSNTMKLTIDKTLILNKRYNITDNTHLVFFNPLPVAISGTTLPLNLGLHTYSYSYNCSGYTKTEVDRVSDNNYKKKHAPYTLFYNPTTKTNVQQIPYLSFEITKDHREDPSTDVFIPSETDGDIQLSRVTIMDALDNFSIILKIPKTI